MKEISELIVVILKQQSSRKLGWEGDLLKIAYFRNSLESNLMKLNWKSGETHNIIGESKLFHAAYKCDLQENILKQKKMFLSIGLKMYY